MGGPTNTQPRYRPPPPGSAPPPPPPPGDGGGGGMMGGHPLPQQQQQQQGSYYAQQQQQQQQQQQPQQSYYAQQQQQPPQPSYYAQSQQQQPPQQQPSNPPSRTAIPGSNQSYASRSAAASSYSPHNGSQQQASQQQVSQHSAPSPTMNNNTGHSNSPAHNSAHNSNTNHTNNTTNNQPTKPNTSSHNTEPSPHLLAEQTQLLHQSTQKITEYAYHMQRAMENNDVCSTLEKACLLLEELGDPNHGLHHRGGNARSGTGGGMQAGAGGYGPPGYYSSAGGVPPLGNYGDTRPYPPSAGGGSGGGGGNGNGWVTPLTPKNYYELHMRAMDEMPSLEEYLLGLCHVPSTGGGGGANYVSGATNTTSGPTNYAAAGAQPMYSTQILYETVQYCPRVVPRLYLQICLGAVSIRCSSSQDKLKVVEVMEELGEAAKCVQCPVRGLFLRYYLLMALKDLLPDGGLDDAGVDGEEGGSEILPLSPVGQEILRAASSDVPTSPPPMLPPPPPPATDGVLFPDSPTGGDAPLFSDSPLAEPNTLAAPASSDKPTASTSNKSTTNNEPRDPKGTVQDSYQFILSNLLEMNRLWIRIKHMPSDGTKATKRQRQRERNDLRILVGSNLNRLSQLEGISAHTYGSKILPRILEEISTCRDPLAQAYLMDCLIQVFPSEFHLETLEVFLGVCPKLREKVNVRTILTQMMERLLNYFGENTLGENDEVDTNNVKGMMARGSFDMFEDCIQRVMEARGLGIPVRDVVRLYGCLLNYALKITPLFSGQDGVGSGTDELMKRCIVQCATALETLAFQKKSSMMGQGIVMGGVTKKSMELDMEIKAITELEKLLSVPLESMGLQVLEMKEFGNLLAFLPWGNWSKVSMSMVKSMIAGHGEDGGGGNNKKKVQGVQQLEQLFAILAPLLRDEGMAAPAMYDVTDHHNASSPGGSLISRTANLMGTLGISPSVTDHNELFGGPNTNNAMMMQGSQNYGNNGGSVDPAKLAEFREEQSLIAKLIHVLDSDDTDVVYQMLNVARRHLQNGGAARVTVTLPAIVFEALRLLRRVEKLEFPEPVVVSKPVVAVAKADDTKEDGEDAAEEEKEELEEGSNGGSATEEEDGTKEPKEMQDGEKATADTTEDEAEQKEDKGKETAAAEDDSKEKDSSGEDPSKKKDDKGDDTSEKEVVKEETKTETTESTIPPITEDEPPVLLFPEFTKSVNCRKILVFLQKTVAMLAPSNSELAFKLYLEIAIATDVLAHDVSTSQQHLNSANTSSSASTSGEFTSIAYDFLTQAFLVYEDEITESTAQIRAITSIVGSLLSCKTFDKSDYEALITKTAQYAAKLLKKPDQCRMVCLVSRLFYVGGGKENAQDGNTYRNPQRVLECLQRGLKIADSCSNSMSPSSSSSNVVLQLFVEILDYYVYYYEIENPVITDKFVSGLIALINEHFESVGVMGVVPSGTPIAETKAYYGQVLDLIKRKKMEESAKERFGLIIL